MICFILFRYSPCLISTEDKSTFLVLQHFLSLILEFFFPLVLSSVLLDILHRLMQFHSYHHRHRRRETHKEHIVHSLQADRDVGLSFLYRPAKSHPRLSQTTFPTYYSLAYLSMPYLPKNSNRSFHSNLQIILYNFLERPTGLKCFLYHFFV